MNNWSFDANSNQFIPHNTPPTYQDQVYSGTMYFIPPDQPKPIPNHFPGPEPHLLALTRGLPPTIKGLYEDAFTGLDFIDQANVDAAKQIWSEFQAAFSDYTTTIIYLWNSDKATSDISAALDLSLNAEAAKHKHSRQ